MSVTDTTRLNAGIRAQIYRSLMEHTFHDRIVAVVNEHAEIAAAVYADRYDFQSRTLMATLPEGWMEHKDYITVNFAGESHNLHFDGKPYIYECHDRLRNDIMQIVRKQPGKRIMPYSYRFSYEARSPFAIRYAKHKQAVAQLNEDYKAAARLADNALKSYTTIGTLKKAWPEVTPFLPTVEPVLSIVPSLPAICVEDLNAAFRLPKEEACASH